MAFDIHQQVFDRDGMPGKMERGFDLSSEEGINEWMETYNAELTSGGGLRIPLPGERDENAQQFHNRLRHQKAKDRRKRNHKRK
jgi:hypothetical protein